MRLATACSGIGAPEEAARSLGWESAWCAEVAPFPSRVLATRHPGSTNLGDLEALARGQTPIPAGGVDVLVAGTPCQSFSVAGLRRGLADPRGLLTLAFLGLVDRVRPPWVVWENVPGVLSADGGRAFGAFLGALGELGYGWAYRILDARFFGVPQRRRRVFVVASPGDWRRCAAVLLEPGCVRGHPPPRRETGEDVAGPPGSGSPGRGWSDDLERSGAFIAHAVSTREGQRADPNGETLIAHALRAEGHDAGEDGTNPRPGAPAPPLAATGRPVAFHVRQDPISGAVSPALGSTTDGMGVLARSAVRRLTPLECERLQGFPDGYTRIPVRQVRRARLSSPRAAGGDYEEIGGEVWQMASDAARYHALGNSMAVPVLRWLFRRIDLLHRNQPEGRT